MVAALVAILVIGAVLRVWQINAVGLNSDEAVYAGQGASIAGDATASRPSSRSSGRTRCCSRRSSRSASSSGIRSCSGAWLAAARRGRDDLPHLPLGSLLYGRRAGLVAALLIALMPYHVVVTRQVLLDGPMMFFATLSLYLLARYAATQRHRLALRRGGGARPDGLTQGEQRDPARRGLRVPRPHARRRGPAIRHADRLRRRSCVAIVSRVPALARRWPAQTSTGGNFLAWQLFRRPNHDWIFYPTAVPLGDRPRRRARPRASGCGCCAGARLLAGDAAAGLDRGAGRASSSSGRSRASSTCCRSRRRSRSWPRGCSCSDPMRARRRTPRLSALRRACAARRSRCAVIALSLVIPSWQRDPAGDRADVPRRLGRRARRPRGRAAGSTPTCPRARA